MSDVIDLSDLDLTDRVSIGEQVTFGGYSMISRGTLLTNGKHIEVAIKALLVRGHNDTPEAKERIRKRFYREVLLWRKLQHSNIVPLFGYLIAPNESPTLISPWYINGNVIHYLSANLNADRRALALDVVNGLDYLHSIPVAHGDLKGENVLVNTNGHASLCDFGMSQFIDEASQLTGFTTTNANNGGTDRFMYPELLEDHPKTIATDMWALGCLIVQILTDVIPYGHLTRRQAVLSAIMRGDPPVANSNIEIESCLWNRIKKCWSITQENRPRACELGIHLNPTVDFAPSLKRLALSGCKEIREYRDPRIKFSPDGKYLAIAGAVRRVGVWKAGKDILVPGRIRNPDQVYSDEILSVAWSASQRHLLVRAEMFTRVFAVEADELLVDRKGRECAAFLPGADAVVFTTQTGEISIQQLTPVDSPSSIKLDHDIGIIDNIAITPDHQYVIAMTSEGLNVCRLNSGKAVIRSTRMSPADASDLSRHISISQDGLLVLISDLEGPPELWGIEVAGPDNEIINLSLLRQYRLPTGSSTRKLESVQFGGTTDQLVIGMQTDREFYNGSVYIWDRTTVTPLSLLGPYAVPIRCISLTWDSTDPDDIILAVATWSNLNHTGYLQIWSVLPLGSADMVNPRRLITMKVDF